MREEIDAAVHFMGRVISASNDSVSNFSKFKSCLSKLLEERFQGHWHAEHPGKGQGYRSIRLHPTEPLDPVLMLAAKRSDFSANNFIIPVEFTLWVDPKDVSCRFGDLKATYCTVFKNDDNKASTIDVDELLETAKAVYIRQQQITIKHNCPPEVPYFMNSVDMFSAYGHPSSSPPYGFHMYGYLDHISNFMSPPRLGEGAGGDGSTPPPPPYQPSFTSTAVNTTPRKNGKNGNFRKGNNGAGRGSKHHHHNSDGATYNHNHNNNHNTNGNMPNGTNGSGGGANWGGDRYHWSNSKGARNQQHPQQQQQQQHQNGSGRETK